MVLSTWDQNTSKEKARLFLKLSFLSWFSFPSSTSLQEYRHQAHFFLQTLATQVLDIMTSNFFEGEKLKIWRSENDETSQNVTKPYEEFGNF